MWIAEPEDFWLNMAQIITFPSPRALDTHTHYVYQQVWYRHTRMRVHTHTLIHLLPWTRGPFLPLLMVDGPQQYSDTEFYQNVFSVWLQQLIC